MEDIIMAFKNRVSEVGWIDKQTVEAVREKVQWSFCKQTYSASQIIQ